LELHELLEKVTDSNSFLKFVYALRADRLDSLAKEVAEPSSPYETDANGWENPTIETFLEGAASWAETTDFGVKQGIPETNYWKRFAVFLFCGKIYE
jgi:hypothetical protein